MAAPVNQRGESVAFGAAMALAAGAVWSFGAVTARIADRSDAFQYLIWRSIGVIIVVEAWAMFRNGSTRPPWQTVTAYRSGRRMIAANLALLLASIGFVYALKATSAANAAFLGSTTPLFGALVARVFLGERIHARTGRAIGIAFVGLVIMVLGDLEFGDLAGDLAALASATGFAFYTAIVRSRPERDWSPVLPGYAILMVAICAAVTLAQDKSVVPPGKDVALALLHGGLFIVGGTLFYNAASRSVPAAAMTVFAQTEMILVPLWAFLVLSERPDGQTLLGGTIIMIAVVGTAVLDAREAWRTQLVPT